MMDLTVIEHKGTFAVDSREVAQMIEKQHAHLLRDIKGYMDILAQSNFGFSDFFMTSTYQDTTGRTLPCYLLTRKGCDMVANKMTGEKGVLFTAAYVTKFEQMEQTMKQQQIPQTFAQALRLAADQAEQLEVQRPLVMFAKTCAASKDSILVREMAKVASKNGLRIGEKRLYQKLREWKLIFSGSTEPYQEYVDRGYFEVVQSPRDTSSGVKIFKTTRVTPKGQIYILSRLKREFDDGRNQLESIFV